MHKHEIGEKVTHKAHGLTAIIESVNTYRNIVETRYYYSVRFPDGRTDQWEAKEVQGE